MLWGKNWIKLNSRPRKKLGFKPPLLKCLTIFCTDRLNPQSLKVGVYHLIRKQIAIKQESQRMFEQRSREGFWGAYLRGRSA